MKPQSIQRVNHRMGCYRCASVPILERPKPFNENQGWVRTEERLIEPLWSRGPILPTSLVDLLERCTSGEEDDEETDADIEMDIDDDTDIDDG